MELSSLAGNSRLKEQLSRRGEGRGLSHAYILSGPTGSGRHTLARLLAAAMVCSGARTKPCGLCAPCKKVLLRNMRSPSRCSAIFCGKYAPIASPNHVSR